MNRLNVRGCVGALCAGLALSLGVPSMVPGGSSARASVVAPGGTDKVHLKDGTVLEGTIVRELDGWVWLKRTVQGVDTTDPIDSKQIDKIERASDAPGAVKVKAKEEARPAAEGAAPKARSGVPRAAIITLEGEVGIQFAAKPLHECIDLLKKEDVDIVVLKVNSGGGLALEVQRLSDVIENEYKKNFTTVAWIQSAISAAAMSSHAIEDIYFMPNGNYGACTGWSGGGTAMKGRALEEILFTMEKISARGKHPKEIMRAMQISGDDNVTQELQISGLSGKLSADIDERTGEVRWYQSDQGKYILNPRSGLKILTFNSEDAMRFKFARGVAATKEELAKAMGYNELEWVGKEKKGIAYPVSLAEEHMLKWRKDTTDAEENFGVYLNDYRRCVALAQSTQDKQDRGAWINKARVALNKLRALAKEQPNLKLLKGLSDEWFDEQEDLLRKLAK